MSFEDQIKGQNIPEARYPQGAGYDGPPRIYWHNGEISKRSANPSTPGSFYVSENELSGYTPEAPWEGPIDRFQNEQGYVAERLGVIFIARRSQPFRTIKDAKGAPMGREWHDKWYKAGSQYPSYITGPSESVYTEWVTLVDGFYSPGGEIWSVSNWVMKGMVGMRVDRILQRYQKGLLSAASKIARKPMPFYSFRLPLAPETDAKGKLAFTESGYGTQFQLPDLLIPDEIGDELLTRLYVGQELLERCAEYYSEYEEWCRKLRAFDHDAASAQGEQSSFVDERPELPYGSGRGNSGTLVSIEDAARYSRAGAPARSSHKGSAGHYSQDEDSDPNDLPF